MSYWNITHLRPSITFLLRLVHLKTILKSLRVINQPYLQVHTKRPLIHHLLQNHYLYTVKKINRVKSKLDEQSSSLLACMEVSDSKASFTSKYLLFLELHTHTVTWIFKLLDENNNHCYPKDILSPPIKKTQ